MRRGTILWLGVIAACGGPAASAPGGAVAAAAQTEFGPLEVGADYARTFNRINREPFQSPDHGNRWVNTYANDVALPAVFADGGPFPVGSIVVKESFEDDGGKPGAARGPTFVMEKRAAGYDAEGLDWWWAIHWEEPSGRLAANVPGPIYWRGKAGKVAYCWKCHAKWSEHDGVAVGLPETNLDRPGGPAPMDELGGEAVEEVEDF